MKKGEINMRKNILVALLLLMALVITLTSCEAETNALLSSSTPRPMSEDDERALDPFLADLNAELEAIFELSSTPTQFQRDLSTLLDEVSKGISYIDVTHKKGEGTLSFTFSSEEGKDSLLLTFTNYEVSESDLRKYYLTGTIDCFFSEPDGSLVPDSSSLTIKYTIDEEEHTDTLNKASGDDTPASIDGNSMTLMSFFEDIIGGEASVKNIRAEAVLALMSDKGLTLDTTYGDVFVKGDIYLNDEIDNKYIYLNPIRLLLEKPIVINDKEYNGKVELKVEIIYDGTKLTILDCSVAFNLAAKTGDVTNKYGGLVEFYLNTRPTAGGIPSGAPIPLRIDIKSFYINDKAIRTDDVYEYVKLKLATK